MGRTLRIGLLTIGVLVALVGTTSGLLVVLPAAVLAVALALGYFPGERVLEAVRRAPRRRRAAVPVLACAGGVPGRRCVRGGALLAFHLAVRPPPLSSAA